MTSTLTDEMFSGDKPDEVYMRLLLRYASCIGEDEYLEKEYVKKLKEYRPIYHAYMRLTGKRV